MRGSSVSCSTEISSHSVAAASSTNARIARWLCTAARSSRHCTKYTKRSAWRMRSNPRAIAERDANLGHGSGNAAFVVWTPIGKAFAIGHELGEAFRGEEGPSFFASLVAFDFRNQPDVGQCDLRRVSFRIDVPADRRTVPLLVVGQPGQAAVEHLPCDSGTGHGVDDLEGHERLAEADREDVAGVARATLEIRRPPLRDPGNTFERLRSSDVRRETAFEVMLLHLMISYRQLETAQRSRSTS